MLSAFAGGHLFGARTGSGAPRLLALHGWRGSHEQMLPALGNLPGLALDLPGFGSTPAPDSTWGTSDYAKAVMPALEEMGGPAVVFGYSFGGRVAAHLAVMAPDLVDGVVFCGVPLLKRSNKAKVSIGYRLFRKAYKMGLISEARMEAERRRRGSADYRAARGVMRDIFVRAVNETYEDQLRAISCPVDFVWAENDTEAPVWIPAAAQPMVASGKTNITVVPGADHWMPMNNPQPLHEVLARCCE